MLFVGLKDRMLNDWPPSAFCLCFPEHYTVIRCPAWFIFGLNTNYKQIQIRFSGCYGSDNQGSWVWKITYIYHHIHTTGEAMLTLLDL